MSEKDRVLRSNRRIIIQFAKDGRVVTGGGTGGQARLSAWTGAEEQLWRLVRHPSQIYGAHALQRWGHDQVLDVSEESKEDSAKVLSYPMKGPGGDNQIWHLDRHHDDVYRLTAHHSGKVLDAQGGGGPALIQYPYNKTDAQRWRIAELVPYGEALPLRSSHQRFITADPNGSLINRVDHIKSWELLTFVRADGSTGGVLQFGDAVALRTSHGTYLSAQADGQLVGGAAQIGASERFTLTRPDGATTPGPVTLQSPIALRGAHGKWVMAHSDGTMNASAAAPRAWEHLRPWPASTDGACEYRDITYPGALDLLTLSVAAFRCLRPATGIEAELSWKMHALGMAVVQLGATKIFSAPVNLGIALTGVALLSGSAVAILIDLGREPDQLYFAVNGAKVWPRGKYEVVKASEDFREFSGVEVPTVDFRGSVELHMMEYDSGSSDDLLGVVKVESSELELLDEHWSRSLLVGSDAEDSLYEVLIGVRS